ncbi:MAG: aminoglycoside phosphotransferase family protein [Ilumatobacter sp.]|uniref:aminoglycoside phosphotransferase family protein n=1 Tax=Ilumatobacter sp. TaxID=1967498 RepID=UPI003296FD52
MVTRNMATAKVDVDENLVRSLLADQHPDLADLPIHVLANGWDNVMFRLGDELTVRLPRREMSACLVEHEQAVLPGLAEVLPIPIPAPVRFGRPALGYPSSWSVNPWIPGTFAATTPLADPTREARRLGEFLAALHVTAPTDAPPNPHRGHFVGDNTVRNLDRASRIDDGDRILERWHELVDVEPWPHAPTWIHGDLHGANVLVDAGEISGVIDFGDVCAGDPATDLSVAWSMFDVDDRDVFRAAAGTGAHEIDDATWQRAEAWALHFALVYTLHSADDPTMRAIGERLRTVLLA